MTINFEQDRVESVTQIDAAKTLSDKVLKLKDLEDEIANAEESINKLKEQQMYKNLLYFQLSIKLSQNNKYNRLNKHVDICKHC